MHITLIKFKLILWVLINQQDSKRTCFELEFLVPCQFLLIPCNSCLKLLFIVQHTVYKLMNMVILSLIVSNSISIKNIYGFPEFQVRKMILMNRIYVDISKVSIFSQMQFSNNSFIINHLSERYSSSLVSKLRSIINN